MLVFEMFEQDKELTLIDALGDFLPLAVKHLNLTTLPKIKFNNTTKHGEQASFGMYVPDDDCIMLVIANRQPVDILRTLAHELVHCQQRNNGRIDDESGRTGSPIEDEANAEAGVIIRNFAKQHPQYLSLKPVLLSESRLVEKKRKRKSKSKKTKRAAYSGGYYGYYWGGGESGSAGDGAGGESIHESLGKSTLVGALAAALSMVPTPSMAEPSDAATALNIYRSINRYKDYDSAALEGEANQELMNILRTIEGRPNQSQLLPIIKRMINSESDQDAGDLGDQYQ